MSRSILSAHPAALWALLAACAAGTLTAWVEASWAAPLAVALLLLAALAATREPRLLSGGLTTPAWLLGALPAWGLLQLLTGLSVYNNATLKAITYWSALTAAFVLSARLCASAERRHLLLTAFGSLAAALGWFALIQPFAGVLGLPFLISAAPDAYAASFANRNMYACFAELALPVLLWLGLRNGVPRWHWLVHAGVLACSVLLSGSRSGALLIFSECVLFAFVFTRGQRLYWKLAFGAAAAALLAAVALSDSSLLVRLQYGDPLVFRKQIYLSGMDMLADRPLAGFGLGAFSAAYPAYALFDNGRFVNLAHNDWLQIAVEAGLPGLALLVTFAALLLAALGRSRWAYGVPFVMVHAIFDFPLHRIGVAAWFMVLAGALWAARPRGGVAHLASRRVRVAGLRLPSGEAPRPLVPSPVDASDRSSTTRGH
ncbi:MAG: O-antigen ligase family protein [Acidobacteria bacterium]|nr:O-antigen ligase family protein [Acidobacteriota bacterium]